MTITSAAIHAVLPNFSYEMECHFARATFTTDDGKTARDTKGFEIHMHGFYDLNEMMALVAELKNANAVREAFDVAEAEAADAKTALDRRITMERSIVTKVVVDALAAGYRLSVNNGGDTDEISPTSELAEVLAALFATDEEMLHLHNKDGYYGTVYLVYGNCGYDVIADNTTNIEYVLAGAEALADTLEE